ncbi:hypothetical protein QIW52_14985 [Clostridioides difficile]|nr:hypothetical protein [Clostridioides difficile]
MKNYIAKCLSSIGTLLAAVQIIGGLIIALQKVEAYSYIEEYSPIMIGIGITFVVSGIITGLVLKGLAELVENSADQTQYQKEILMLLKNNNISEKINEVKIEPQFTNEELPKL